MFIGVSFKFEDKQVSRLLAALDVEYADIYYSPLSSWFMMLLLALYALPCLVVATLTYWQCWLLLLPWLAISYLCYAWLSTSVAVCEDKLVFINPNFPFYRMEEFGKGEITRIVIGEDSLVLPKLFLVFGGNYIQIETTRQHYRFYCVGLEMDAYDENWTEKTIDELHYTLKAQNYPVTFTIKD